MDKTIAELRLEVLKLAHYPGRSPQENLDYAQAYMNWIEEAQQANGDANNKAPAKKPNK